MKSIFQYINFKTIGYLILGYAALAFGMNQTGAIQGVNASWYNQLILTIATGIGALFLDGKSITFQNILSKILDWVKNKQEVSPLQPSVFESLDEVTQALNKSGDIEGIALCRQLNNHLFDIRYSGKKAINKDAK